MLNSECSDMAVDRIRGSAIRIRILQTKWNKTNIPYD